MAGTPPVKFKVAVTDENKIAINFHGTNDFPEEVKQKLDSLCTVLAEIQGPGVDFSPAGIQVIAQRVKSICPPEMSSFFDQMAEKFTPLAENPSLILAILPWQMDSR